MELTLPPVETHESPQAMRQKVMAVLQRLLSGENKDVPEEVRKLIQSVVQKNTQLENEVDRLCRELDDATGGVNKRGYLYKYRTRDMLVGTK